MIRDLMLFCSLAAFTPSSAFGAQGGLTWLGHAAFLYRSSGGAAILIDPWVTNPNAPKTVTLPEKIDAVLVTHGHSDHVGEAFSLAKKHGAALIASFELTEIAKKQGVDKAIPINQGGSQTVANVKITAVNAVHSSSYGESHEYAGAPLGFVLSERGGPTVYHAGDTGVFGDMALVHELYRADVALLPIGGVFTMKPTEAAAAAKLLRATTIVPMHFGTFPILSGTPEELAVAMKKAKAPGRMRVLAIGQPVGFKELL